MLSMNDVAQYFASASIAAGAAVFGIADRLPDHDAVTADFFEIKSISALRVDGTAVLYVDRAIIRPIVVLRSVSVMEETEGGWSLFCFAQGPATELRPEASRLFDANSPMSDDSVSLKYWTWGACPVLPDGPAQIWTTWTPQMFGLYPISIATPVMESQE